jgi:hypothetical protein
MVPRLAITVSVRNERKIFLVTLAQFNQSKGAAGK